MEETENICMLMSMGFSDIELVKKALRKSGNDITDAVTYLTNPPAYEISDEKITTETEVRQFV